MSCSKYVLRERFPALENKTSKDERTRSGVGTGSPGGGGHSSKNYKLRENEESNDRDRDSGDDVTVTAKGMYAPEHGQGREPGNTTSSTKMRAFNTSLCQEEARSGVRVGVKPQHPLAHSRTLNASLLQDQGPNIDKVLVL